MSEFSPDDKLEIIEELIEKYRCGRSHSAIDEYYWTYHILKEIAADIRGSMEPAKVNAVRELQRRIDACGKGDVYIPQYKALALEVLSRWPAIRQALETTNGKA